jgi:hypothetical protein
MLNRRRGVSFPPAPTRAPLAQRERPHPPRCSTRYPFTNHRDHHDANSPHATTAAPRDVRASAITSGWLSRKTSGGSTHARQRTPAYWERPPLVAVARSPLGAEVLKTGFLYHPSPDPLPGQPDVAAPSRVRGRYPRFSGRNFSPPPFIPASRVSIRGEELE